MGAEEKARRLYGAPPNKRLLKIRGPERKYFDSGDYALSKAGISPPAAVGTAIPQPESIPHVNPNSNPSTSPTGANGTSPPTDTPLKQHSEMNETIDGDGTSTQQHTETGDGDGTSPSVDVPLKQYSEMIETSRGDSTIPDAPLKQNSEMNETSHGPQNQ